MTLVNDSQELIGGQDPAATRCDGGTPSARSPIAARGPMSADVAVMFLLLMRQMDRLRESSVDSTAGNDDASNSSAHVD